MAFSQANITHATAAVSDADLLISWGSSDPTGTVFQVYISGSLVWHGTERSCHVPMPKSEAASHIDIGAVGAGEDQTDFSSSLPTPPGDGARVTLTWAGGAYLGGDVEGFEVFMGTTAGGAVSYTAPVATVTAYPQGLVDDGYGVGGYGDPGYGSIGGTFSWTSAPLAGGTWNFAVKPFDGAGNRGTAATTSAVVAAPPGPPASNSAGKRLTYTYNSTTHVATLHWLAPI